MAKITKVFISGKIANLIAYERNGTECVRTMPEEVLQTEATKRSAKNFGKAVTLAKFLRWEMSSVFSKTKGRVAEYQLSNGVSAWLASGAAGNNAVQNNPPELAGLQFSKEIEMEARLKFSFAVDWAQPGKVLLQLPAINPTLHIKAPANTQVVHLTVAMAGSIVARPESTESATVSISIDYTNATRPVQAIELPFEVKPGSINVIAVAVQYSKAVQRHTKFINDPVWNPAGIETALYQP